VWPTSSPWNRGRLVADNEKFSLHAAIRFTQPGQPAEIKLYTHQVRKAISMMSLPDMDNFRAFMRQQHNLRAPFNGIMEGLALAKFSVESWLEGYAC
jgi:hypothetical protein